MSAHAPKQLALEAYLEGQLSPAGRARLQRHLEGCAVCRDALKRMERYQETAATIREAPLPPVDWRRIEASLERAPNASDGTPAPSAAASRRWLWPAVAVAAAVALAWMGRPDRQPQRPSPSPAPSRPATPATPTRPDPITAQVTLRANQVQVGDHAPRHPLDARAALEEGTWLHTGPGSSLHLRLGPGTGIALGPNGALELATLREGRIRLRLLQGRVDCTVAKLGANETFVVEAGAHAAHVRGTRFHVAQTEGHTQVAVNEGRVEVRAGRQRLAMLAPGERWSSRRGQAEATDEADAPAGFVEVVGLDPSEIEAWLQVPSSPLVRAWLPSGDAAPIEARDTLQMRLPPGPHTLRVVDRRGQTQSLAFELAPEGTALSERTLRRQLAPPPPRSGTLEVSQIMPVLQRGMGGLRACYERELRSGRGGATALTLQLRVSPGGAVDQVKVEGQGLSTSLVSCVRARATRWRFPAPDGGPARLELPVNLRPRQN